MPRLHERIETPLPLEDAFAFVADFANASAWDPGVASSERIGSGPVGVGARYRLGIRRGERVVRMDYVVERIEQPHRVVLVGSGSGVLATDDIRFTHADGTTVIDYTADIRLTGLRRLATPLVLGTFARIARDARDGMQQALDRMAVTSGSRA